MMQENSCIAFSYRLSWFCPSITGSLDKHNVNVKVFAHVSLLIKVSGGRWGSSVMKSEKLTKPCKSFRC